MQLSVYEQQYFSNGSYPNYEQFMGVAIKIKKEKDILMKKLL